MTEIVPSMITIHYIPIISKKTFHTVVLISKRNQQMVHPKLEKIIKFICFVFQHILVVLSKLYLLKFFLYIMNKIKKGN